MTTINTSSLNTYSTSITARINTAEAPESTATTAKANMGGTQAQAPKESSASTPREQAIEALQEQIKQTQQLLQRQQAQLAAAQNSKAPDELKAQQVMAIQQQIAGTMAQLSAQQGALLELMKGTVKTTA